MAKPIKIGVRRGGGPAPGYQWSVGIIDFVHDEVMKFLTPPQYQHISMQVKELAKEVDPSHPSTVSVLAIEDFFELREKGGVLGKKNVRVFFGIDKEQRSIVILGGINKGNEGQTPDGTRIAVGRRWRKYRNGDYGALELPESE